MSMERGRWVVLSLGEHIECRVFVVYTQDTTETKFRERALAELRRAIQ